MTPATGPVGSVAAEISGESDAPGLLSCAAPARTARRRGLLLADPSSQRRLGKANAPDREWLVDGWRPAGAAIKAVPPDLCADPVRWGRERMTTR